MPRDNYTFTKTDNIVTKYLKDTEVSQIVTEQASDKYTFEFHTGHETGNPIYFRPDGNNDNSNMPKIDTKNKAAGDYNTFNKVANHGKLTNQGARTEILAIIRTDWDRLQTLAQRFWVDGPPAAPVEEDTDENTTTCDFAPCTGQVPLILKDGKRQKAMCDTCFTFQ